LGQQLQARDLDVSQAFYEQYLIDGSLGQTFTFGDPDGYQITLHDRD
jgi:hypothetical protein